jgi:hypothetical protein
MAKAFRGARAAGRAGDEVARRAAHRERLAEPTDAPLGPGRGRQRNAKARTRKTSTRTGR